MNAAIEYITAGTIICLILGITGQYATNMVYDRISLIERSSGMEKADKITDMMLLSPGSPVNWGESDEEPEAMGLALENAIKLYQLDASKVQHLSDGSLSYIPPGRVRDLLGLSAYYYTDIRIYPLFNITVEWQPAQKAIVKIVNQWSMPLANVNITAAHLNVDIGEVSKGNLTSFMDLSLDGAIYVFNMTNALGTCTLNLTRTGGEECLLILATQLSAESMTTWPSLSEYIIGTIESSMGSISGFNTETVYRNAEIDGLNYVVRFTLWS